MKDPNKPLWIVVSLLAVTAVGITAFATQPAGFTGQLLRSSASLESVPDVSEQDAQQAIEEYGIHEEDIETGYTQADCENLKNSYPREFGPPPDDVCEFGE